MQLEVFLATNPLFGLLNIFSGGGLANLSIIALGMNLYINARSSCSACRASCPGGSRSSAVRASTGATGSQQYTRYLTVPLASLQAYGFLVLLPNAQRAPVISNFNLASFETTHPDLHR